MERQMVMIMGICTIGLVMLGNAAIRVNAISCFEAVTTLSPCLSFLAGPNPSPNHGCCLGTEKVKEAATTTETLRELCTCFKKAVTTFRINTDKAKQLPDLCHVKTPVPIDPNVDCSKISA